MSASRRAWSLVLCAFGGLACLSTEPGEPLGPGPAVEGAAHWLVLHEALTDFEGGDLRSGDLDDRGVLLSVAEQSAPAEFTGPAVETRPFRELLLSWNVEAPEGTTFFVDLRVGGAGEPWSPWLRVGDWHWPPGADGGLDSFAGGRIDVDYFRGERDFERAQYRITAGRNHGSGGPLRVRRVALCFSAAERALEPVPAALVRAPVTLDVPLRSQRSEAPEIASRVCSPTAVAMVLDYRGVSAPTRDVATVLYDARFEIFGNWTRAVQGAYTFGVPGYLARFDDWSDVEHCLETGQPLIVSIAAKPGQLDGAPYEQTAGHLLVLVGVDEQGDLVVNDPAAPPEAGIRRTYRRDQLQTAWMGRGGTAYVLLAPGS